MDLCAGVTCSGRECDPSTGLCNELVPTQEPTPQPTSEPTSEPTGQPTAAPVDLCIGVVCEALSECHEVGECDSATGLCSEPTKPDYTTNCDDGDPLTGISWCESGVCVGMDLCAGVTCSQTQCDPSTGLCEELAPTNEPTPYPTSEPTSEPTGQPTVDLCIGVVCEALSECH